jgi:uncharacterized metal-binding protein YceD (DUF177 family)
VKFWRTFDIEVIRFVEGTHEIDFEIGDSFFEHFQDNELVHSGTLTVRVNMNKGANIIELNFHIKGEVKLTCDRSLEQFGQPLDFVETIFYKYGIEEKEINEDMMMITRDTPTINVAQLIYEFILLALPTKKIHPDYRNEMDEEDYEGTGSYAYIDGQEAGAHQDDSSKEENTESVDPRWDLLKKFKNKE